MNSLLVKQVLSLPGLEPESQDYRSAVQPIELLFIMCNLYTYIFITV